MRKQADNDRKIKRKVKKKGKRGKRNHELNKSKNII